MYVRSLTVRNLKLLRDLRSLDNAVTIHAEFGFSREHHAERGYPGLANRPPEPPLLFVELTLPTDRVDLSEHAGYWESPDSRVGLVGSGLEKMSNARSQQLRHWFAAGYGVSRALPVPMSMQAPDDLALVGSVANSEMMRNPIGFNPVSE